MEDIPYVLEKIVSFCENRGALAEVMGTWRKEIIVTVERNDIKLCISQHTAGVGIRTLINSSVGFSSCNSFNEEEIKSAADKALRISKRTPPAPFSTFASPGHLPEIPGLYDPKVEDFDERDAVSVAETMVDAAQTDPRISIDTGEFAISVRKKAICTSSGISAEERKTRITWSMNVMAHEGSEVGPYEYEYGRCCRLDQIYVEETSRKVAEKAVADLHPEKIDSFSGDVILGPEAVSFMIGEPVAFSSNANNMYRGQSVLAGKCGEKVASDIVSIRDNAVLPGEPTSSRFDREGTPHQDLVIVENGCLKSFMYDSLAAKRDNHLPTGNAAGSFRDLPRIGITSLVIEGREPQGVEALIRGTEKGLIITRFSGAVDPISGDFSGAVKGAHLIKSGEIQHPVKEAAIAGNAYSIICDITDISRENAKYTRMILPSVKIPEMQIIA